MAGRSHAIVIGGGIAGLCAARAIEGRFERVTLIERDVFPDTAQHRAGTPQSHHVHGLLLRGARELERLFPGLEADLRRQGADSFDMCNEIAHCTLWGWARRGPTGVSPLGVSRVLLESTLRKHALRERANLTVLQATRVTGLCTRAEGSRLRVTGVTTSRPDQPQLHADLVVDASGRSSKTLQWLEQRGVAKPEEEIVDSHAGYASRFYELAPDPKRWWRGMVIDHIYPDHKHWGLLMPIESGRHVLTLAGVNGAYPGHDERGFQEHLHALMSPALARVIAHATPLSEIHGNRALWNRVRHFERWKHGVGGLVALGDCAIAFNPIHGQGMSMAAAAANALGDICAAAPRADAYELTRLFHRQQWNTLQLAWHLATTVDLEWPGTTGKRRRAMGFELGFATLLLRAGLEYPEVVRLVGGVYQLVASPYALLHPRLLAVVTFAELRRRLGGKDLLTKREDLRDILPPELLDAVASSDSGPTLDAAAVSRRAG